MAKETIGIGTAPNDGTGDALRTAFGKVNDNFDELYAGVFSTEVAVASASTCNIGAADSPFVEITGTTAITSFGSAVDRFRCIRFSGALTLTHGSSLVLPGAANITTAAGDTAIAVSDATGKWRVYVYSKASGAGGAPAVADLTDTAWTSWTPTVSSQSGTVTGATITKSGSYKIIGKTLFWKINCTLTSIGSGSPGGAVMFTVPSGLAPAAGNNAGAGYYVNDGALAGVNASSNGSIYAFKANGTTLWANGNVFAISGYYELS